MKCFICGLDSAEVSKVGGGVDAYWGECARCGKYYVTGSMSVIAENKGKHEKFLVSAYLRERDLNQLPPPMIFAGDVPEGAQAPTGSFDIGWDTIISQEALRSVSEQIDRTLCNLSKMASPGKWIPVLGELDWVVAHAEDEDSWEFIIKQLLDDKYVEIRGGISPGALLDNALRITPKGWNRVADIERGAAALLYKQAFVAMWFNDSMNAAWETGFKPGIEEGTGIKSLRVDLKEHNDKICDVIISEIKKSSFLVADFTGDRGGVYFEAGFAKGLGIPVIFTCQKGDWEKKLHFDTRQYNHIIWDNPEDLKIKLKNRISATIPLET